MLTPTTSARRAAEPRCWLPTPDFSNAPDTDLRPRLQELHDRLVERAYQLDRHGRTDASDEVNAVARELDELLS